MPGMAHDRDYRAGSVGAYKENAGRVSPTQSALRCTLWNIVMVMKILLTVLLVYGRDTGPDIYDSGS